MAVEVQTWGTLGTMVPEQRDVGAKTAEYLEKNEVYDLFGHLLRQVVVHQPANPIKFLKEQLQAKPPPLSVCVIGPPGINRSKYCQKLAAEYKVAHVHVGKLLKAKRELQATIEAGALVEDDIVINLVQAELKKVSKGGYILDGFPRTKVQAQTLANKEIGFSLDKVLLLNTGEKAIRAEYEKKLAATGSVPSAAKEDMVNTRLQQYQRHVLSIVELFKNVIRQIEVGPGDDDQGVTYTTIKSNLHVRQYSNAPYRPPRICVVGPCGSGRSSQCKFIAKQYGVVHVDLAPLIRAHQKANGMTVEDVPPEFLSDEELCSIVGKRLNQTDCVRKGWVLDAFPKTAAQAEFLRQSHLWPTRFVQLVVSEDEVVNRVSNRRIDPITCIAYYKAPNSVAVRQRLVQADFDQPDRVRERFQMYEESITRAVQTFALVATEVEGRSDIGDVMRNIFMRLDEPLQSELDQDPAGGGGDAEGY